MLKQRVITALVLLAVLLPALFHPRPEPFCALALLLIGAGAWEWSRLNGLGPVAAWASAVAGSALLALLWWRLGIGAPSPWLWVPVGLLWAALAWVLLHRGVAGWAPVPVSLRWIAGLLLLGLAWWAMAQARYLGVGVLLSILVLVWAADIGAYFGGKTFGRRKLAFSISPGKTWEGVYAGTLAVLAVALTWSLWVGPTGLPDNLYSRLAGSGWVPAIGLLLGLTAMSVAGDLIESLVKRSAGVKDSSHLLPGHGGVLDRVDALLPVLPLALMCLSLLPAA